MNGHFQGPSACLKRANIGSKCGFTFMLFRWRPWIASAHYRDLQREGVVKRHFRFWQVLLQKSFWGDDRKFLESPMRLTRGGVRDHIVSFKIDHRAP